LSRQNATGFTLIETLVATMILAIGVVTVMQLFSGGLRSGRVSEKYSRAVFDAKSKMNELLLVDKLAEGRLDGVFDDGYKWDAVISRLDAGDENGKTALPVHNFEIRLTVYWVEGNRKKKFVLDTIQLAKEMPEKG
jgi:general secretion pathway protein I